MKHSPEGYRRAVRALAGRQAANRRMAREIAEALRPEMERIDAEAEFAGQVEQSTEAEDFEWVRQVSEIILRHLS